MKNRLDKKIYNWWLLVPGLLIFVVIFVIPTLSSFYFGFCTWNLRVAKWTGLQNFKMFFTMINTKDAIKNTFVFTFWETLIKVVFGLPLAAVLTSGLRSEKYLKSVLFIPSALSLFILTTFYTIIVH